MTDTDLIAKKLALIETYVRELRVLGQPDEIPRNIREERFAEHTLQIAVQAALDVASHIVSDERLGEPRTNRDLFSLLERGTWIEAELSAKLVRMAGFRNIIVHGYAEVDPQIVKDVVLNHLDDLLQFAEAIRARLKPA